MCMGGGGDGGAAEQRRKEEERQARIREGKTSIDDTFSRFDNDFYSGRRQSYMDYATPQLDDQYTDAMKDLRLALARSGLMNSSASARRFGDLKKDYDIQAQGVADKAVGFENTARKNIEAAKSDLYTQNSNIADPSLVAQSAASRAASLTSLPEYSPLTQLFAGVTDGIATQFDLERRGKNQYDMSGLFNSGDSSKVVQ